MAKGIAAHMPAGTSADEFTADADMLADPCWFPHAFDPGRRSVEFVFAERSYWAEKRFLDIRWMRERLPQREMPAARLNAALADSEPIPLNFIWHTSLCCSTLLADLIEQAGCNLSLREPQILVELASARRMVPRPAEIPYRPAFWLLARRFGADAHITVKPSNFANNLIGEAMASTSGKMLFLYSDLPSFLVGVVRRGREGETYTRDLFSRLIADGPVPGRLRQDTRLSAAKMAALAWHMQLAAFRGNLDAMQPELSASLDCETLLAQPEDILRAVDRFFKLELGEAHIEKAAKGPLMKRHAKELRAYDAGQRHEEDAAIRARLGSALDDVVAWSHEICPETARAVPLPRPLTPIEKVRRL